MENKILIFGAGKTVLNFLEERRNDKLLLEDEIVGIIDNDINKKNTYIKDYRVSTPDAINTINWDYIIIASIYCDEIKKQLIDEIYVDEEKILSLNEYHKIKFIKHQYEKNIVKNQLNNAKFSRKFNPKSTVVYTAIIGDYDELKTPEYINEDMDYVCFTDNKELQSDIWEVRYVENVNNMDPRLLVREFKTLPHKFFPQYDTSIWVDASFNILNDLAQYMSKYQKYSDFLLFPHHERDCVYDEAAACLLLNKDNKDLLINQMYKYCNAKYPANNGLVLGGFLVRNHNEKDLIKVMEAWWEEIKNESHRDQISLPYVLDKHNYSYDLCDLFFGNNKWCKINKHKEH